MAFTPIRRVGWLIVRARPHGQVDKSCGQREFFIDNLLVRIHFIIVMIRWTGLAPWEFEFSLCRSARDAGRAGMYLEAAALNGSVRAAERVRSTSL